MARDSQLASRHQVRPSARRLVGVIVGKTPRARIIACDQCPSTDAASPASPIGVVTIVLAILEDLALDRDAGRLCRLGAHDLNNQSGQERCAGSAAVRRILTLERHRPNGRDRSALVVVLLAELDQSMKRASSRTESSTRPIQRDRRAQRAAS